MYIFKVKREENWSENRNGTINSLICNLFVSLLINYSNSQTRRFNFCHNDEIFRSREIIYLKNSRLRWESQSPLSNCNKTFLSLRNKSNEFLQNSVLKISHLSTFKSFIYLHLNIWYVQQRWRRLWQTSSSNRKTPSERNKIVAFAIVSHNTDNRFLIIVNI